jgi:hypothetical protein
LTLLSCGRAAYSVLASDTLGHATVAITLDTYSHAIPAMQEEAAARIAALVFANPDDGDAGRA